MTAYQPLLRAALYSGLMGLSLAFVGTPAARAELSYNDFDEYALTIRAVGTQTAPLSGRQVVEGATVECAPRASCYAYAECTGSGKAVSGELDVTGFNRFPPTVFHWTPGNRVLWEPGPIWELGVRNNEPLAGIEVKVRVICAAP